MSDDENIPASQAIDDVELAVDAEPASSSASRRPRARKRLWAIAVLLCMVVIAAGTYLTYTAYRAGDFLKAVAATGTTQALFTSDLLSEYTTADAAVASRSVIVDSSGETCSFTFRIYNCLLDNRNVFNSKDVYANLFISADGVDDDWRVAEVSESSTPITDAVKSETGYGLSFPGYAAKVRIFTVTFSTAYLDQAKFTIKAKVNNAISPGTNLAMLAETIVPNRQAIVTNATVSGDWVDKGGDNVANFDAYNYRVTVTGKKTRVKLSWGEGVELDPFFASNHANSKVDSVGRTATFDMEPGSQVVNFFRASGESAPVSWDDMSVSVRADE